MVAWADSSVPGGVVGQVQAVLKALGGMDAFVRPGDSVLLKPNFVAPFPQAATGLAVIAAVIAEVKRCGGRPILAESAGFEFDTQATFDLLGVPRFAAEQNVELLNLDQGEFTPVAVNLWPLRHLWIARAALEAGVVINLPKLKRHNLTGVTLGMKNLMGLLSRPSRRQLHAWGLEQGIAELDRVVRPGLTLMDALTVTSRAAYGDSTSLGLVVGGKDAVAVDLFCCRLLGVEGQSIGHLRWATQEDDEHNNEWGNNRIRSFPDSLLCMGGAYSQVRRPGRLYRLAFRLLYLADEFYAHWQPDRSLIPWAHWWALRPHLTAARCDGCGECARACPIDAVDVSRRRILAERCMRLRCLRCVAACPRQAIQVVGRG